MLKKTMGAGVCAIFLIAISVCWSAALAGWDKPSPDQVQAAMSAGNARFVSQTPERPHTDAARLAQAGTENQGDHAVATVLTCSDSRLPVEILFDVGVMDVFVVRVAGNVMKTDEIGSIEYGACHVNTPLIVVLGHTRCGAVAAVTQEVTGHGHPLERNIPPLVAPIIPAVQKTMRDFPKLEGEPLIEKAIEENVWEGVRNLFLQSAAVRELAKAGRVKVVGAVYNVGTGEVVWLPDAKAAAILQAAEADPKRAMDAMSGGEPAEPHGMAAAKATGGHETPAAKQPADKAASNAPAAGAADELKGELEKAKERIAEEIKRLDGKLEAAMEDGKKREATISSLENFQKELRAASGDARTALEGLGTRLADVEGGRSWLPWTGLAVALVALVLAIWVHLRVGGLTGRFEALRAKTRNALQNLRRDIRG